MTSTALSPSVLGHDTVPKYAETLAVLKVSCGSHALSLYTPSVWNTPIFFQKSFSNTLPKKRWLLKVFSVTYTPSAAGLQSGREGNFWHFVQAAEGDHDNVLTRMSRRTDSAEKIQGCGADSE